ncbi:MAG: glycosyl transferase, group 1 family protein [Pedobacter sp.]|jgi:colanic acid biosynthesis glycosyl transferase WcaI|nr:glycosyl transferase, group 1 family protein [Pedobacter sp.]
MQKRVLLIGGNFYPEPIGIGKYNGEMMHWLAQNGYDCTVITSFPYYPQWKVQQPYTKRSFWYKREVKYYKPYYDKHINIYRCPLYVPNIPTGSKRILNGVTFFLTSLLVIIKLLFESKYDYIITVVPSFETGLLAILYKSIRGGKFLYHIQDLQIDAARDLKIIRSKWLIQFLFRIEKFILKKADVVSSVSTGMMEKVKVKCNKNIEFFPNWVDSDVIYPIEDKTALKSQFSFSPSDKIILYSGAIGEKQGLENILYAAESFRDKKHIKFIICGAGPYLKQLELLKQNLNLQNVVFMPTQPIECLNDFLNMADLHLIIQKADASDLVMPSKLTNILAVGGIPIITARPNTSLYELVTKADLGLLAVPEDVNSLVSVIGKAIEDEYVGISVKSLEYARTHFSLNNIITNYSQHLDQKSVHAKAAPVEVEFNNHFAAMDI